MTGGHEGCADLHKCEDDVDMAYRVIADHIRTLTIALRDGATLSDEACGLRFWAQPSGEGVAPSGRGGGWHREQLAS